MDATNEPEEPDVQELQDSDVQRIDDALRAEISAQLNVTKWQKSQLNEAGDMKGLVTMCIVEDEGVSWQYIASRINRFGRKWVQIGMFDITKADPLAKLVFGSVSQSSYLDD